MSLPTLMSSLVFDFLANRLATYKNTVSSLYCKYLFLSVIENLYVCHELKLIKTNITILIL